MCVGVCVSFVFGHDGYYGLSRVPHAEASNDKKTGEFGRLKSTTNVERDNTDDIWYLLSTLTASFLKKTKKKLVWSLFCVINLWCMIYWYMIRFDFLMIC